MRRSIVLGVLSGVGVFSMPWAAGRQLPAAVGAQQVRTIEVEKIKDNLFEGKAVPILSMRCGTRRKPGDPPKIPRERGPSLHAPTKTMCQAGR
jgi:hypothetical protein